MLSSNHVYYVSLATILNAAFEVHCPALRRPASYKMLFIPVDRLKGMLKKYDSLKNREKKSPREVFL